MKCKHCSMDGTYRNEEEGTTVLYCKHHAPKGSVLAGGSKKNFTPLILVVSGVLFVSLFRQYTDGINGMMWMMDFMGIFLVTFGLFKLTDLKGFKEGFATYDLIAKNVSVYGHLFPFIEIGLGIMYLLGYMYVWQNGTVLVLSVVGCISAYKVIQRKDEVECVCLGTSFAIPMTWVTFTENLIMGLMVFFMILL